MADINAQLIKELRDKTNAGMMDCKAALVEAGGDLEEAETILRKKGIAAAGKKASRDVKEGVVHAFIDPKGRAGSLVEVNCETDFVAKTENFTDFVGSLSEFVARADAEIATVEELEALAMQDGTTVGDAVKAKIAELGENLVVKRFDRYAMEQDAHGVVAQYIHLAGKVGVLVEVTCEKPETATADAFRELVKDITLQVAAAQPLVVSRDEVDPATVAKEKEVYAEQVKDKPANIVEKIVDGKLDKFYGTVSLLEQGFIKDPDTTIGDLLAKVGKQLDDTIEIKRFSRFAVGEQA